MKTLLESLADTAIRVEQNGDIGMTGRLVNVQTDYASLFTGQRQIVHYPYAHIKSIGINVTELPKTVPIPKMKFPATFYELLESLIMKLVRIEHGERAQQGVLASVTEGHVCLVLNHRQMVFYPLHQIKNISPIFKIKSDQTQTTNQDPSSKGRQNASNTNQDGNLDEGNTSGASSASAGSTMDSSDSNKSDNVREEHAVDETSAHRVSEQVVTELADRNDENVHTVRYSDENTNEESPSSGRHNRSVASPDGKANEGITMVESNSAKRDSNVDSSASHKLDSRSTNHVTFHEVMARRISERSGSEHGDRHGKIVHTARSSDETKHEIPPSSDRQNSAWAGSNLKPVKEDTSNASESTKAASHVDSSRPDMSGSSNTTVDTVASRMPKRLSTKGLVPMNNDHCTAREDHVSNLKQPRRCGKGESAPRPCLLNRLCKPKSNRLARASKSALLLQAKAV